MQPYQRWIWQLPEWPKLTFDAEKLQAHLKTMKKLLDAGPKGYIGGMTTCKHEQISKTSTPTAARDLIDLEQRGLLVKKGMGRATRYYPAIDGWAEELG